MGDKGRQDRREGRKEGKKEGRGRNKIGQARRKEGMRARRREQTNNTKLRWKYQHFPYKSVK